MVRFYWRCLVCTILWLIAGLVPVIADDVTLRSADGKISLRGELKSFDGDTYVLDTEFGTLTFKALGVECQGAACPDIAQFATDLVIGAGGSTAIRLIPALIEGFALTSGLSSIRRETTSTRTEVFLTDSKRIPVARMEARRMSTKTAFAQLADDRADFAVSMRDPNAAERLAVQNAEKGNIQADDQSRILALDALVILVSRQNPVKDLSRADIAQIFSGSITNWAAFGGPDVPISLFLPAPLADHTSLFQAAFLSEAEGEIPLAHGRLFLNARDLSDAVARDPFAIGFAAYSDIRNAHAVAIRGECGIRQIADAFSIQSGDYPYSQTIRIYSAPLPLPSVAESFLTYLESPQAQEVVQRSGFVDLDLRKMPLDRQQARVSNAIVGAGDGVTLGDLKNFVRQLSHADRLSVSFRFEDGSTQMDGRSRRNIRILAHRIESGDFDGRELIITGFSDSQGSASGNKKIALQRARLVRTALQKAAPRADLGKVKFRVLGMGEISPIACNDDEAGRRVNRRVEIWLD